MAATSSGWQVGIWPDTTAPYTEADEREALRAFGIEPDYREDFGIWVAAIPARWVRTIREDGGIEKTTRAGGRMWSIVIELP